MLGSNILGISRFFPHIGTHLLLPLPMSGATTLEEPRLRGRAGRNSWDFKGIITVPLLLLLLLRGPKTESQSNASTS